jgi:hypothetical protein
LGTPPPQQGASTLELGPAAAHIRSDQEHERNILLSLSLFIVFSIRKLLSDSKHTVCGRNALFTIPVLEGKMDDMSETQSLHTTVILPILQ